MVLSSSVSGPDSSQLVIRFYICHGSQLRVCCVLLDWSPAQDVSYLLYFWSLMVLGYGVCFQEVSVVRETFFHEY